MSSTRDQFVNLLKSQVGYHEGHDANGNWNNIQKYSEQTPGLQWSDGQPWCATFECWAAHQAGMDALWPMTASCATAVAWWQKQNRFTEYPVLGGPFYMGPGGGSHTGIVWKYDSDPAAPGGGGWIYTVEGNTNDNGSYQGDGVYLHQRPRRGPGSPYGYGVPAYKEGTISADPQLGGTTSAAVAAPAAKPSVSLAHVIYAAQHDPAAAQGNTSYKADVLLVERALQAEGLLDGQWVDGSFGTKTIGAYSSWQRRLGYTGSDADGIPGKTSLTRLGDKHGFIVTA